MSSGKFSALPRVGKVGAVWGVLGVSLLFGSAVFRLVPYALELDGTTLAWYHWGFLLLWLVLMGVGKGYHLFFRKYAPRVVARAAYLARHPTFARVVFAPLFCMGFFHATRKRKIFSYGMTSLIVGFIVWVRTLDQPWHGMVDAGVAVGLGLGMVSIWFVAFRVFAGQGSDAPTDTPE